MKLIHIFNIFKLTNLNCISNEESEQKTMLIISTYRLYNEYINRKPNLYFIKVQLTSYFYNKRLKYFNQIS